MMLSLVLLVFAAARLEDLTDRKADHAMLETDYKDIAHADNEGMRGDSDEQLDTDEEDEDEVDEDDEEEDEEVDEDADASFEETDSGTSCPNFAGQWKQING